MRAQRQACGGGVSAEADQQPRRALGDEVERIAQVQSGNRAARAAREPAAGGREGDHRAMMAILEPAGEEADDALVPALVVEDEARGLADGDPGDEASASRRIDSSTSRRSRFRRSSSRAMLSARA